METPLEQSTADLHAPEVEYRPPPEAKKRGAVIGSAPKLNPEGILAAAREAKEREEQLKRKVRTLAQSIYKVSARILKIPFAKL